MDIINIGSYNDIKSINKNNIQIKESNLSYKINNQTHISNKILLIEIEIYKNNQLVDIRYRLFLK